MSVTERQYRHLDYRVRALPRQLENARRKVAALEAEALRYGFSDLVQQGSVRQ